MYRSYLILKLEISSQNISNHQLQGISVSDAIATK